MTHQRPNHTRGFTLIELLTVIAIIGILAGIIIPTVGAVQQNAKKSKTKAMYSQWASAMDLFRQDYGYYPTFGGSQPVDINGVRDQFIETLTGEDTSINTKGIRYYSFSNDSFADPEDDSSNLVDAFLNDRIFMAVDSDQDGVIDAGDIGVSDSDVRGSVVFYSEENESLNAPEVKSWE